MFANNVSVIVNPEKDLSSFLMLSNNALSEILNESGQALLRLSFEEEFIRSKSSSFEIFVIVELAAFKNESTNT